MDLFLMRIDGYNIDKDLFRSIESNMYAVTFYTKFNLDEYYCRIKNIPSITKTSIILMNDIMFFGKFIKIHMEIDISRLNIYHDSVKIIDSRHPLYREYIKDKLKNA